MGAKDHGWLTSGNARDTSGNVGYSGGRRVSWNGDAVNDDNLIHEHQGQDDDHRPQQPSERAQRHGDVLAGASWTGRLDVLEDETPWLYEESRKIRRC